jgi:hypothetical protein
VASVNKKSSDRRNPIISKEELERRHQRWLYGCEQISTIVKMFLVCLTIFGTAYVGIYLPIEASHGETTTINFLVKWLTNFRMNVVLPWALCGGAMYWASSERKKRLLERHERDERIKKLESKIDPNRSSSNLTVDGLSAIKDK